MLAAIRLNDQPMLLTHEIGNEGTDWLLSPELGAGKLPIAQHGPQFALGVSQLAAKALRFVERIRGVAGHALTLPPLRGSLPLPHGERDFLPSQYFSADHHCLMQQR